MRPARLLLLLLLLTMLCVLGCLNAARHHHLLQTCTLLKVCPALERYNTCTGTFIRFSS